MSFRSQSVRVARALAKELHPAARRTVPSAWRSHSQQPLITNYSPSARLGSVYNVSEFRYFSTKSEGATNAQPQSEGETPPPTEDVAKDDDAAAAESESADEPNDSDKIAELESQIKDLKDNLLRSLAEQDNTRRIAQRDVANSKNFAITSFAKSLLDTSDNLTRVLDAVPEDLRHDHENHPVLANLYEGITMTDDGLTKAFAKNGLVKFGEKGEKFDPNMHEALFEYPDPEGEAGNIGQIMKRGFKLNGRVVRPAEVGVVKAP
eukprot:60712_1